MLGKLLKYEMPAVGRKLLPLYGAFLALAVILGITIRMSANDLNGSDTMIVLMTMLYVCVATAIVVMTFVMIIQRFSQNLLGDGGYFSMVLPVKISDHIANKTISAGLWTLFSGLLGMISGLIVALIGTGVDLSWIFSISFSDWMRVLEIVIEALILCFVYGCKTALQIYAAITIGHQARRRKGLCGFGAYCGIIFFEGIIGSVIVNTGIYDKIFSFRYLGDLAQYRIAILFLVVIAAIFGAIYFLICKKMMTSRLNLQ